MNKIKIHIDNIPKISNSPIFSYCRYLIDEGVDRRMSLEVYGPALVETMPGEIKDILYMRVNVGNGAKLAVKEDTRYGTPRIVKYMPKTAPTGHPAFIFPRGELG